MSEQTAEATAATAEPTQEQTGTEQEATLGPEGEKALAEFKKRAREAEKARKELEARVREFEDRDKTEAQKQAEALSQTQAEVAKWQKVAVGNHIKALAAQDFADPSDAASALDPAKYLDANGEIDEATITADLAALLERKPHWRRQEGSTGPRVPAPNPAQGSGVNGKATVDPASQFAAILSGQLK